MLRLERTGMKMAKGNAGGALLIGRLFRFLTKLLILCMVLICLAFVWMRWVEPSLVSVTRTQVRAANVPAAADGLRIVQFTDTHFGFDYDVGRFERAVEKINELDPHIVVFTGDLLKSMPNIRLMKTASSRRFLQFMRRRGSTLSWVTTIMAAARRTRAFVYWRQAVLLFCAMKALNCRCLASR